MSFAESMLFGGRCREQGDFVEALAWYKRAIESACSIPDEYEADIQMAVTLRLAGKLDDSLLDVIVITAWHY